MRTLAWLCGEDGEPIDDYPLTHLELDFTTIENDCGYFEYEGKKYLYYGE